MPYSKEIRDACTPQAIIDAFERFEKDNPINDAPALSIAFWALQTSSLCDLFFLLSDRVDAITNTYSQIVKNELEREKVLISALDRIEALEARLAQH